MCPLSTWQAGPWVLETQSSFFCTSTLIHQCIIIWAHLSPASIKAHLPSSLTVSSLPGPFSTIPSDPSKLSTGKSGLACVLSMGRWRKTELRGCWHIPCALPALDITYFPFKKASPRWKHPSISLCKVPCPLLWELFLWRWCLLLLCIAGFQLKK